MPARTALLVAGLLALPLLGQPPRNPQAPAPPAVVSPAADSQAVHPSDSAHRAPLAAPPATTAPDSLPRPKSRADTVLVVKHRFNHREQIITGSVVMTCLALMMVVMNNYNPR